MSKIAEFRGIVVEMFHREHAPPHFHASYGEYRASIGIDPIVVLEGRLPTRARRLVFEWAAMHRSELVANWDRAMLREPFEPIEPLR